MPSRDAKAAPKSKTTSKQVAEVTSTTKAKMPAATNNTIKTSDKMPTKKPAKVVPKIDAPSKAAKQKVAKTTAHAIPKKESVAVPYKEVSDEDYMNNKQKEYFRQLLLNWRQQLMEEVDRTVHHMKDEAANFPDPNDRATQEEEFSLELRARDRERKLIKKIEEALQKIDADDYGYCDGCGIEIGIRRLEARPTANLCIDCKTLDEIKEKQNGGG